MNRFKEAVKQDIIGFLMFCFLVGAGFVWLGSAYGWLKLSDGDRVNATVLWLTALAIFWYAYETYQLKKNTSDQVGIQEDIMLNEFLPILEPVSSARTVLLNSGQLQNLKLRNLGRGPAKFLEARIANVKINLNVSLAVGDQVSMHLERETRGALRQLITAKPERLSMKIGYQDIYGRRFETNHIRLDRQLRGGYSLRQGAWDFKRINRSKHDSNTK